MHGLGPDVPLLAGAAVRSSNAGREHTRQLQGEGSLIKASATWEGETLVVEQRADSGAVLRETYSGTRDGGLAVLFQLQSKQADSPLMFRVVYERDDDE